MANCIKVKKSMAEKCISFLKSNGMLDNRYRISRDDTHVYIPVICNDAVVHINDEIFNVMDVDLKSTEVRARDYTELVDIPVSVRDKLPGSFDIVGDIAIIKLPDELLPYRDRIGRAMLAFNPAIKTVLLDTGVSGEYRVRKVEVIAGIEKTHTVNTEYGMRFEVDLSHVYFSPRLATERQTVCNEIESPCVVIDMFAGVGPFAISIAKKHPDAEIYAIDINPDAYALMLRNISINKVKNVHAICGDARSVIPNLPDTDYIIMNLPHSSTKFLPSALEKIKRNGKIFLYQICRREEILKKIEEIKNTVMLQKNHSPVSIAHREVHTYSPADSLFCIVLEL